MGDYVLFRKDRNRQGSGVALFIHKSLTSTFLCASTEEWTCQPGTPEYILCEVKGKGIPPLFAAVVYRPPHAPFIEKSNFINDLTVNMQNYSTKVIMGDFNANQLCDSFDAVYIRNLLNENSLKLVPHGATYHRDAGNWLDLCIIDQEDRILDYWKSDTPFIDNHSIITATIDVSVPKVITKPFSFLDFNAVDKNALNEYLRNCDWSVSSDSPDSRLSVLCGNLTSAIDRLVPNKTIKPSKHNHPWYTTTHRNLILERDRHYRKYRRTRQPYHLQLYRQARDHAHKTIESSGLEYYYTRLSSIRDPQILWKKLRHLGVVPPKVESPHDFTVEQLNEFFCSVSYDPLAPSIDDYLTELQSKEYAEFFFLQEIGEGDVVEAINHFNTQARGPDGIPQCFIAAALPSIATHLRELFNASIRQSVFPSEWKKSLVIALNKVKTPSSPSDFRPISLLNCLSKAIEYIVHKQINAHIDTYKILDCMQTGFKKNNSTQAALIKLTDDIRAGINRKYVTLLLLFDFSKAFDSVCHVLLLRKLENYGFSKSALGWIASYLSGRHQAVKEKDGTTSSYRYLNTGVPQGSVLGPLLFCLYVNDISLYLDPGISRILYADDLQIYAQCHLNDLDLLIEKMRNNADRISSWAAANHLRLNVGKTKAMVCGSSYYINDLPSVASDILIGDTKIKFSTSVRNLGLLIDNKLSWKEHVNEVCKRANTLMYRLRRLRASTTHNLRKHLIQSLLWPIIDYCSLACCNITKDQDIMLQRLVNTGIRYIYGVRRDEHITQYRRQLGWTTHVDRRLYFAATMFYKINQSGQPNYLANSFLRRVSNRPIRGR